MAKYLEIALNRPLPQTFIYQNLEEKENDSLVGFRVDIPFGNSSAKGFVVSEMDELPHNLGFDSSKIRKIKKVVDKRTVFTKETISLARWISHFYVCSLGETLSAMIPSGRRESGLDSMPFEIDADFQKKTLSEEQKKAVNEIIEKSQNEGKLFHYVYGATGTGKTEVFLSVAERILEAEKGVIYLVPEISLTRQAVSAVLARFGNQVAVLHSALTPSQRLKEWNRILSKEARIVVGARSAIFAPVPDLGLIIIDEEHDGSYKSGETPRYHARQCAMHRSLEKKIPLLLGSATPSVEAWKLMKEGKISSHILTKRLAGGAMPDVRTVDLSLVPQDSGAISPELKKEIDDALKEKRQTILFLNRRGFSHYFRCASCGFEMKCKNCSVSLTLHKKEKRLRCHYCGWSVPQLQKCPECGSLDIGYSGFGTEFVENETRAKFPNARILRLDTDSVSTRKIPEKIDEFKKGEWDILLGTQMVAKGLNFPKLKLVGVLQADIGLHLPDFRSSERTFSLITQVAGRAGRFFPDGKVLVQTYQTNGGPVFMAVCGNTTQFYEEELQIRKATNFPPYSRLVRLVFRSRSEKASVDFSESAAVLLHSILDEIAKKFSEEKNDSLKKAALWTEILGPSECPLSKVNDNYRQQILLRGPSISILQLLSSRFLFCYTHSPQCYIECDVDPTDLL